jgi:hypothetical protein
MTNLMNELPAAVHVASGGEFDSLHVSIYG